MKHLFIAIALIAFATTQTNAQDYPMQMVSPVASNATPMGPEQPKYRLYPTANMWTFIRMNTVTGAMDQVQYAVNDDANRKTAYLSGGRWEVIDNDDIEVNGRFVLYPTTNMYQFIQMDQVTGRMWQIQWSMDHNKRGMIAEIE